jgi:hypothetical protein
MVKALKNLETKWTDPVNETSFFYRYFLYTFNGILNIEEKHLFTNTFAFKKQFMRRLAHESSMVHRALDRFRNHYIAKLSGNKKIWALIWVFIKWVQRKLTLIALRHAQTSLRLTINIYSAFHFLFYIKKPMYFPTMCFTVLCWNILSIVTNNSTVMVLASVFLIYPFFIVDHIQMVIANLDISDLEVVLAPFTVYTYPIILCLISLYVALIFSQNAEGVSSLFWEQIEKLSEKNKDNDGAFLQYLEAARDMVLGPLRSVFRYFTLVTAIFTALYFISLLSTLLVVFALVFIWKESLDKKYWQWFTAYTVMHILTKQLGHYLVASQNYNIEVMALVGIIGVEREASSTYSLRVLMLLDFFLVFLCFQWYAHVQFQEQQAAFRRQNEILKGLKDLALTHVNVTVLKLLRAAYTFVHMILRYYSIWVYHVTANLVLLSEPRDIVTIGMLLLECLTTIVHFAIWRKSGVHPYKLVYRIWSPNFYFLVVYALARYVTFFLQYIHARAVYVAVLSFVGFDGQKIVDEKLENLDQINNYTYQYYVKSYFRLLLLVTVAVFTRNSLKSVIEANEEDAAIKLAALMKASNAKPANEVLNSTIKRGSQSKRSSRSIDTSSISGSDYFGMSGKLN